MNIDPDKVPAHLRWILEPLVFDSQLWYTRTEPREMIDWYAGHLNPCHSHGSPLATRKLRLMGCALIRELDWRLPASVVLPGCVQFLPLFEEAADLPQPLAYEKAARLEEIPSQVERLFGGRTRAGHAVTIILGMVAGAHWKDLLKTISQGCEHAREPPIAYLDQVACDVARSHLGDPHRAVHFERCPPDSYYDAFDDQYYLLTDAELGSTHRARKVYRPDVEEGGKDHANRSSMLLVRHDWISGQPGEMARSIYHSPMRYRDELPMLADLLDRLDCDEPFLLDSLRGTSPCTACGGVGRVSCAGCGGAGQVGRRPMKRPMFDPGPNRFKKGGDDMIGEGGGYCQLCMGTRKLSCAFCKGRGKAPAPVPARRGFWALDALLASWARFEKETPR